MGAPPRAESGSTALVPLASQACRGEQHDPPVVPLDVVDSHPPEPPENITEVDAATVHTLPAGADFLMCYSVAKGESEQSSMHSDSFMFGDLVPLRLLH